MSLETVMSENNDLLRELIALWKTGAAPAGAPAARQPSPAPQPPADQPASTPSPAPAATTTTQAPATSPAASADAAVEVTYDQIKPLIVKAGTQKRDQLVALLQKYGAARGPELKPADFPAVLADLQALLS